MFSAMVLRGLLADNSVEVILSRALVGLFGGVVFGAMLGWAGMIVVMDNPPLAPDAVEDEADAATPAS